MKSDETNGGLSLTSRFLQAHSILTLYVLAAGIGLGAGLGALAFGALIHWFEDLFLHRVADALPSKWLFPVIPMLGILVANAITRRFAPEARGHGVPEVMAAVATRGGIIRPRVVAIKAFVTAVTIGTGGAVGREGPIVQIGSAIGSFVGQVFKFSGNRVRLLLACGAAAGISATFNAPIAGMMFASEVILFSLSGVHIAPIVISSVVGAAVARTISGGSFASLEIGQVEWSLHWAVLALFAFLGLMCGVGSWLFTKVLYKAEDTADAIKMHWAVKSVLIGLIAGVIVLVVPQVRGIGYDKTIEEYFMHPEALTYRLAAAAFGLFIVKILATSATLAGGGSGGVFAPSLFLGAAIGCGVGILSGILTGIQAVSVAVFGVCGMAAMVAGTTRAPITAILIVFEMTHDYRAILPLMLAVTCSYAMAGLLEKESIYTMRLARRGEAVSRFGNVQALASVRVSEIMQTSYRVFRTSDTLADLVSYIRDGKTINFPVVDESDSLYGLLSTEMFRKAFFSQKPNDQISLASITIRDVARLYPQSSLLEAVEAFAFRDVEAIPVVAGAGSRELKGMVYRRDIEQEYKRQNLLMLDARRDLAQ